MRNSSTWWRRDSFVTSCKLVQVSISDTTVTYRMDVSNSHFFPEYKSDSPRVEDANWLTSLDNGQICKDRRTDLSEEEAIYSIVVASKRVLKEITLRSDCTFNNFIISPGEHPPKDSHQQWFSGLRGGWEASSRRPGRDGPSDSKGGRLRCDLGVMFVFRIHRSHYLICLFGVKGFSTLPSSKRYDVYWFLVILHTNQLRFMTPQTKLFGDLSSPQFSLVFFYHFLPTRGCVGTILSEKGHHILNIKLI